MASSSLARAARVAMRDLDRDIKTSKPAEAAAETVCVICQQRGGEALLRDCVCRGATAGFVHIQCLQQYINAAENSNSARWMRCGTCNHDYTGTTRAMLARARWTRACSGDVSNVEQLLALFHLAVAVGCVSSPGDQIVLWEHAAAMAASHNGPDPGIMIFIRERLSWCQLQAGDRKLAKREADKVHACVRDAKRRRSSQTLTACECIAVAYGGPKGVKVLRRSLTERRARDGKHHQHTLSTMLKLAEALAHDQHFDEAVRLMEECIEGCGRTFGNDHHQTLAARIVLGRILCRPRVARAEEGLQLLRDVDASAAERYGARSEVRRHASRHASEALREQRCCRGKKK